MGECNEGARSQERMEEMVKLSKQLDFPSEVRHVNTSLSTWLCSRKIVLFCKLQVCKLDCRKVKIDIVQTQLIWVPWCQISDYKKKNNL